MALIEIEKLTTIFGRRPERALAALEAGTAREKLLADSGHIVALRNVTLTIPGGGIFVVMGLSGSGKSTLIRHINRLIDPTIGSIRIDGTDILKLSIPDLIAFRRERLAMVFQHFALLPHRTVLENVAYGLELKGAKRRERNARAQEWIEAVGLKGFEKIYPDRLSGGMRQRVGLARALCVDRDIILMDEPFSALDPLIRSQMQELLVTLQTRLRKTIVFITHDLDEALRLGDTITILRDGEVVQVGRPAEIILRPADDFVRSFVRDVNRARVLTVQAVMEPPVAEFTNETAGEALTRLERRGQEAGYVVAGTAYQGVVTATALRAADRSRPVLELVALVATVRPGAKLVEALPAVLASPFPVPVVGETGGLEGVLSSPRMTEILAPGGAGRADPQSSGDKPLSMP